MQNSHLNFTILSPIFLLHLAFFSSLFLIGNPYLSLVVVLGAFIFYNWYYTKTVINSKFFLGVNAFIIFIFISVKFDPIITLLFAIKLILFFLVINTFISVCNKKEFYFIKVSLVLLGFYLLILCILLSVIKIYFFNAISFFALEKIDFPIFFDSPPSQVFLSFKNCNFLNITENPLFVLDFSNDDKLSDLAIQLSKFPKTKWLFYCVSQMIFLNTTNINLVLIFV